MLNNRFFKFFILLLFVCGFVFAQSPVATEAFVAWANPLPGKTVNAIAVTTTADILDYGDAKCSLREAVISANTNPEDLQIAGECQRGSDTVTDQIFLLSGETYFLVLSGSGEDASKTGDLDLVNNSAELDIEFVVSGDKGNRPIIDASGLGDRVFEIGDPSVSFDHIIIKDGTSLQSGTGIYNHFGKVDLQRTDIQGMKGNVGAAIFNQAGMVLISASAIIDNEATVGEGGGIFNGPDGQLHISSSQLAFNKAINGAAIYNQGTISFEYESHIYDNSAAMNGGGIYNHGTIIFDGSLRLINNIATGHGGGLYNSGGDISGPGLHVISNNSTLDGAGIMNVDSGELELDDFLIQTNRADGAGGGIYNDADSKLSMNNGSIRNHTINSGVFNKGDMILADTQVYSNIKGGIVSQGGEVMLLRTQVYDNRNQSGGGIKLSAGAKAAIHQSAIYGNVATASGGGISATGSSFEMANTTVSGNATEIGIGGGIHLHSGFEGESIRFYNVTVADNSAKDGSALSFISKNIDIQIVNTILTGPEDQTVCQNGTVQSKGHNIVSDESCLDGLETGDLIASPLLKAFEKIDNTLGHRPEFDSPAFGNGDSAVCAAAPVSGVDQRGLAREFGCDIGAIELLQAPPPVTETPEPSETPVSTPVTTATPKPGETPVATATPKPGETPEPGSGEKTYQLFLPLAVKN